MSGVIRLDRGNQPIPSGGTFSSNGYNLHVPSPVDSYVMRPVKNPSPQYLPQVALPSRQFIVSNPAQTPALGAPAQEAGPAEEKKSALPLVLLGAVLIAGAAWCARRL